MFYVVETSNFWFVSEKGTRVPSIHDAKKFTSEYDAKAVADLLKSWGCTVRLFRGV